MSVSFTKEYDNEAALFRYVKRMNGQGFSWKFVFYKFLESSPTRPFVFLLVNCQGQVLFYSKWLDMYCKDGLVGQVVSLL